MKFEYYPPAKMKFSKRTEYDVKTGAKIVIHETVIPILVYCPTCRTLLSNLVGRIKRYRKSLYCINCGRDLRKEFSFIDKARHWFAWLGDYRMMRNWAIVRIVEGNE